MKSANERQVAGNHYKVATGEQHWDRQWRLYGRGYFVGCITKYVERYPLKNGIQDLEKAKHFLEKLIELETAAERKMAHQGLGIAPEPIDDVIQREIVDSRRRSGA